MTDLGRRYAAAYAAPDPDLDCWTPDDRSPSDLTDGELLAANAAAWERWLALHREEWRRRNADPGGAWRLPSERGA